MIKNFLASLDDAEKKQDANILQKKDMVRLLMSYTSTDQVDYSIFTPDVILELTKFAVENATDVEAQITLKNCVINEIAKLPSLSRHHYSCM